MISNNQVTFRLCIMSVSVMHYLLQDTTVAAFATTTSFTCSNNVQSSLDQLQQQQQQQQQQLKLKQSNTNTMMLQAVPDNNDYEGEF